MTRIRPNKFIVKHRHYISKNFLEFKILKAGISMINIIGASIPRSGHHYLERLMRSAFKARLHYCETYNIPNCCKQVPCIVDGFDVVYQKSHDFDFRLPIINKKGLFYIIQFREPIATVLSDRALYCKANPSSKKDRLNYLVFLADKIIYNRGFYKKWIHDTIENSIKLNYDQLVNNPKESILKIANTIDAENIELSGIELGELSSGIGDDMEKYQQTSICEHEYFDLNLMTQYEILFRKEVDDTLFPGFFSEENAAIDELKSILHQRELIFSEKSVKEN